jgi:cytoskeletal protein RodZ
MFEIGSSLRDARARQGLELDELERRTKIRAKYLRALEDERFEQLPAPTYVKGFLRTYADALGLDGRLYVDEYNSRYTWAGDEEPLSRPRRSQQARPRQRRQRSESRAVVTALLGILTITALVIVAWKFGEADEPSVRGITQAHPAPAAVTVVLRAARGNSYAEVREGSEAGTPLFEGTLARGRSQRFARDRLWISIASPGKIRLSVAGRKRAIPAGGTFLVTAGVVTSAPTG